MKRRRLFVTLAVAALALTTLLILTALPQASTAASRLEPGPPESVTALSSTEATEKGAPLSAFSASSVASMIRSPATATEVENVEFVGRIGGNPHPAVAIQGNYAYIGVEPGLAILDVSDPAHPAVVGQTGVPGGIGDAYDVAVAGNYAYVADGWGGLRIINVTDPAAPTRAGSYNTPRNANGVAVAGNYAYVADGWGGLRIVDVTDQAHPSEAGFYDTPGYANSVAVAGNYAYVADSGGLRIINVTDPAAPTRAGSYNTPRNANGVAVAGNYAYVADGWGGLRIVDVSNPTAPTEAGFYNPPDYAQGVAVAGNYAYVADGGGGLRIVDVTDPAHPSEAGFYDTPGSAHSVAVAGNYAYVASYNAGLRVINISNPAAPTGAGFYDMPGRVFGVAVAGNYAYVADAWDGLYIVDVSNPATPTQAGFYDTPGSAQGVAVAGNYAYVADAWGGLLIVDISNPTAPTEAGFYNPPDYAQGVAVAGNYAYVADGGGGLRIVDVTDPAHPSEAGFYDTPGFANDVAVAGNYAYVADDYSGLRIVDVTDQAHPSEVGSCDTPGRAFGVAVTGNYAYVADGDRGLRIVDVTDPAHPSEAGFYDTPGFANDVAVAGNYGYVADGGGGGLRIVDVTDPAHPSEAGSYSTLGDAYDVAVAGGYAYVADGDGGLIILRYTGGGIPHIEVTQATQTITNSVPLIAGKPTFVRVYVDCGPDGSVPADATIALRGYGLSGELPGSPRPPFGGYLSTACRESFQQQRGDLRKTLNFALPNEWAQGTITLRAEVAEAVHEEEFQFNESRSPVVALIPVDYHPRPTFPECNVSGQPSNRIWSAHAWAQRVFPTAVINLDRLPSMPFSEPLRGGLFCASNSESERRLFIQLLGWSRLKKARSDYVFGWLPDGAYGGGLSRVNLDSDGRVLGGQVAFGDDDNEGPRIFAHEMGHLMRRPEIDKSCGVPYEGYRDWPYDPDRHIQEYGVDVSDGSFTLKRPNENYDYMTYCGSLANGTVWTSPWTYTHIFSETLRLQTAAQAVRAMATEQPYFIASGLVYTDDTAILDPIWVITSTVAPENPPAGTQYCLEAQNASGTPLSSYCFDLTFVNYETGEATNVDGFNLMLPYPTDVARIVLKKGTAELAVQSVSANAPVITVLSPNGGETWTATGTYTITWTASDADGDPLTYSVLYSPDETDWVPVGMAITGTQLAVNAAELAGGSGARVRVLASDGVNTSADESDAPFTVGRKPPQAFIISPEADSATLEGTPVWLEGYAYDLEDGTLGDASLSWASSRDGDLGTGAQVLTTLSLGQHTLTFAATDSDANTATATVQVLVTFPEDVVPDCQVDVADIMQVASHWRCRCGDECYDPRYDFDGDCDIDIVDIMLVVKHWGETCE